MTDQQHLETLHEMLMWRRPAGTKSERKFIKRYIEPLGVNHDGYGNLIKRIGDAPVLWSCHTDTVHKEGGLQAVDYDNGMFSLTDRKQSNCLGADDTAGIWLMSEMIKRGVSGLYVFHRQEECGAGGSQFIADRTPALLKDIKCAIALDRKGKGDVITHQFGRCCSDAFAKSLAAQLNTDGLAYKPDSTGMFTDTANYTDLVGECTNLSVGYCGQHSSHESQHGVHALQLLDALQRVDVNALTFERKPGESSLGDYGDWSSFSYGSNYGKVEKKGWESWDDYAPLPARRELIHLVKDYPEEVADFLDHNGIDDDELWAHICELRGWCRSSRK